MQLAMAAHQVVEKAAELQLAILPFAHNRRVRLWKSQPAIRIERRAWRSLDERRK